MISYLEVSHSTVTNKITKAIICACLILLVWYEAELHLSALEDWVESFGIFAPFAYFLLFVALTPVFVSVDVLCLTAGVLFPITTGELTVILATYFSAALIFVIGRELLHKKVEQFVAAHYQLGVVDKIMNSKNGLKLMILLRMTPLPFAMLSYALSVSKVKFWPYLAATSGILIYNCTLVYLGYITKHLGVLIAGSYKNQAFQTMLIVGLVVLIAVLMFVAKIASNALKEFNVEKPER